MRERANGGWREEGLSRDHLATDSAWSKPPPLSVSVSPSPVSREASREFGAHGRPFDDSRVQTANVAVGTSTLCAKILPDLIMFSAKRPLYLRRMSDIHVTAEKGVSERGRRKTAELHTSGAKRADT